MAPILLAWTSLLVWVFDTADACPDCLRVCGRANAGFWPCFSGPAQIPDQGFLGCLCADKGTGKKQDIKITGASTLAGDEVDRMVKDAEKFADEDKKKREAVDVKNQVRLLAPGRIVTPHASFGLLERSFGRCSWKVSFSRRKSVRGSFQPRYSQRAAAILCSIERGYTLMA
jgi:hypothetical protein